MEREATREVDLNLKVEEHLKLNFPILIQDEHAEGLEWQDNWNSEI